MRDLLAETLRTSARSRPRLSIYKSIHGLPRDAPVAMCDASTELVQWDLVYSDRVCETYSVTYNPALVLRTGHAGGRDAIVEVL